jgi:hypothetical protein
MKKRIEKLFHEAGFHKPEVERLGVEHKFEKFAELIVAECINMIEAEAAIDDEDSAHGMRNAAGLIGRAFNI